MRPRILLLPLAAAVIAGLCAWRVSRDAALPPTASGGDPVVLRPAPLFIAHDTHKPPRMVRLASYAGRHRILLVFFDGRQGFDRDPLIRRLLDVADELRSQNVYVFAVSDALPQTNRAVLKEMQKKQAIPGDEPPIEEPPIEELPIEEPPFAILSDPAFKAQQLYGVFDRQRKRTRPAAFLIDRAARVPFDGRHPEPLADPLATVQQIVK